MSLFIGIGIFLALVIALVLWMSHRTYKPGGSAHDVGGTARKTKVQAEEQSTRWSAAAYPWFLQTAAFEPASARHE